MLFDNKHYIRIIKQAVETTACFIEKEKNKWED
jgi:hypothetical protein